MALPGPGTFSSLSAETTCYTYNWQNNINEGRTITYVDCNGFAGRTQSAPAGQSGTFCARSVSSVPGGGVSVDEAGSCSCKTWYTRVYNAQKNANYTFSFVDCNGQPATKILLTSNGVGPGEASFYSCSKSKPVLIVSGGSHDLTQTLEYQYCDRALVG